MFPFYKAAYSSPSILYFGSCSFSRQTLVGLLKAQCELNDQGLPLYRHLEVVSPPEPKISAFKQFVLDSDLLLHEAPRKTLRDWIPPKTKDTASPFDLAIVASFGYFIPLRILNSFTLGSFNIHPSLLPKYRGASPIQYTLLNGDSETGVSVIELDAKVMDSGNLLLQSKMNVDDMDSIYYGELEERLANLASDSIVKILRNYAHYKRSAMPQGDASSSQRAPKFDASFAHISFESMSSKQIYALHRAISYKYPLSANMKCNNGADMSVKICQFDHPAMCSKPLGMDASRWHTVSNACASGSVFYDKKHDSLWIKCSLSSNPSRLEGVNDWISCRQFRIQNKSILFSPKMLMSYELSSLTRSFFS